MPSTKRANTSLGSNTIINWVAGQSPPAKKKTGFYRDLSQLNVSTKDSKAEPQSTAHPPNKRWYAESDLANTRTWIFHAKKRQANKQTSKQRNKETKKQRNKQRNKETKKQTKKQRNKKAKKQRNKEAKKQKNKETNKQAKKQRNKETKKQINKRTQKQTNKQKNKETKKKQTNKTKQNKTNKQTNKQKKQLTTNKPNKRTHTHTYMPNKKVIPVRKWYVPFLSFLVYLLHKWKQKCQIVHSCLKIWLI